MQSMYRVRGGNRYKIESENSIGFRLPAGTWNWPQPYVINFCVFITQRSCWQHWRSDQTLKPQSRGRRWAPVSPRRNERSISFHNVVRLWPSHSDHCVHPQWTHSCGNLWLPRHPSGKSLCRGEAVQRGWTGRRWRNKITEDAQLCMKWRFRFQAPNMVDGDPGSSMRSLAAGLNVSDSADSWTRRLEVPQLSSRSGRCFRLNWRSDDLPSVTSRWIRSSMKPRDDCGSSAAGRSLPLMQKWTAEMTGGLLWIPQTSHWLARPKTCLSSRPGACWWSVVKVTWCLPSF